MTQFNKINILKIVLLTLLVESIIGVALGVFLYKKFYAVARVNGETIERSMFNRELQKLYGGNVLDSLIIRTIIKQEARKQKVTVSQNEVDGELKAIESSYKKSGQDLNNYLKAQGVTRYAFGEQIYYQKMIDKIFAKKIIVSDKEVDDFVKNNKSLLSTKAPIAEVKKEVKKQLMQDKLNKEFALWIADMKKKAKIQMFVSF